MPPGTSRARFALVILTLGALAVILACMPYKAFDLDRYFVPKELVLHACAVLATIAALVAARGLTFGLADWLLAGFLLESAVSAVFATNWWAAERALAISASGALLFWAASAVARAGYGRALCMALALGVVAAAGTSLAQAYGLETEFFSLNRAPGGTFGNRNFIAHVCAMGIPVLTLLAMTARGSAGSLATMIGAAIVSAALVMSRSRAAWLAVLCVAGVMILLALVTRARWSTPGVARRGGTFLAALGVGGVAAVVLPNRLEWKSESPYLQSATGLVNYKEGSGRGRLVQYTNSLRMVLTHPVLGVGPGNWPVVYPRYASRNDPSMSQTEEGLTSNPWPSSDWVAFASERGVVGAALLMMTLVLLLGRTLAELRGRARDPDRVLTTIAFAGVLVATLVVGAFDAVLLLAAPTFLFWVLAGALVPPAPAATRPTGSATAAVILASAIVATLGAVRSATSLGAMGLVNASTRLSALESAETLDPGSYRIRVRLAQAFLGRGDCARSKPHSRAAHDLFPNAAEPRRLLAECGAK